MIHDHVFRRSSEWFLAVAPTAQPKGINNRDYLPLTGPAEVTQGSGSGTDRKKPHHHLSGTPSSIAIIFIAIDFQEA